jgi:hypothetical protein
MVFENPLGSVDNGVIPWQGRSDSGVHLEPFHPHPKGRPHTGQDDQDKNISRFPFDKGSKSAHFRSLKGIKILIATSRAKVRVLRQKSSQGLKWETFLPSVMNVPDFGLEIVNSSNQISLKLVALRPGLQGWG